MGYLGTVSTSFLQSCWISLLLCTIFTTFNQTHLTSYLSGFDNYIYPKCQCALHIPMHLMPQAIYQSPTTNGTTSYSQAPKGSRSNALPRQVTIYKWASSCVSVETTLSQVMCYKQAAQQQQQGAATVAVTSSAKLQSGTTAASVANASSASSSTVTASASSESKNWT